MWHSSAWCWQTPQAAGLLWGPPLWQLGMKLLSLWLGQDCCSRQDG